MLLYDHITRYGINFDHAIIDSALPNTSNFYLTSNELKEQSEHFKNSIPFNRDLYKSYLNEYKELSVYDAKLISVEEYLWNNIIKLQRVANALIDSEKISKYVLTDKLDIIYGERDQKIFYEEKEFDSVQKSIYEWTMDNLENSNAKILPLKGLGHGLKVEGMKYDYFGISSLFSLLYE